MRATRRDEIVRAFVLVLAKHGVSGATIAKVAERAGVAPGLVHHHFADKDDLVDATFDVLVSDFRKRVSTIERDPERDPLDPLIEATLSLGARADVIGARAWASLLAEALRHPPLFVRVRRLLDTEIENVRRLGNLTEQEAASLLAYVIGALVLGAFAPRKVSGFAADGARRLVAAIRAEARAR